MCNGRDTTPTGHPTHLTLTPANQLPDAWHKHVHCRHRLRTHNFVQGVLLGKAQYTADKFLVGWVKATEKHIKRQWGGQYTD